MDKWITKRQYTFEDFIELMQVLRSENGCPWDREQTHESLKPCVMEEAAELCSAIRIYDHTGDCENMVEELGDLLLQVAMHSVIADEEGLFTIQDVIQKEAEKMIRRHPHVFGTVQAEDSEQVLANWEDIKKKEKEGKTWIESPLQEIPREFPALTRAVKLLKKIDKLYEKRETYPQVTEELEKSVQQLRQLTPEVYDKELSRYVGDMLIQIADICRIYKLTPEQILTDRLEDMIDCYEPAKKQEKNS